MVLRNTTRLTPSAMARHDVFSATDVDAFILGPQRGRVFELVGQRGEVYDNLHPRHRRADDLSVTNIPTRTSAPGGSTPLSGG
jgi:hypothetical protein